MRFFGLKTCDTCRKAQKALLAAGFDLDVVDVRADGVEVADLERFLSEFGDALVNTRSTTWRGLDDQERAKSPIELLQAHPTLMKRPVIEQNGDYFLGWGKDVQSELLGG